MAKSGEGDSIGILIAGAALFAGLTALDEHRRLTAEPPAPPPSARRAFSRRRPAEAAADAEAGASSAGRKRRAPRVGEHGPQRLGRRAHESRALAAARGRRATAPWRIPLRGWKHILRRTWSEMSQDHLGLISAGVAFYALLAIFPALGVTVALAGLISQPADFVGALSDVSRIFPSAAAQILVDQATEIAGSRSSGLTLAALFGLLLALYSSSRGVLSLIEGLNVAYDEDEKRGFIWLNVTAILLTAVVISGALVALSATVLIPAFLGLFGVAGSDLGWVGILRWPILLIGAILGLSILYRFGPSREHARWQWISPGALLACGLWLIGTAGFAWYAQNFASYNQTFGTLGGAIVLLMWLWLSAYIVLIGAELNAEIEAQTARDSTTGPELPLGWRGAVKADTLGAPVD